MTKSFTQRNSQEKLSIRGNPKSQNKNNEEILLLVIKIRTLVIAITTINDKGRTIIFT